MLKKFDYLDLWQYIKNLFILMYQASTCHKQAAKSISMVTVENM